ncbi:hypothetical protein GHT06_013507 [Daphnia sinensis]|uniref:HAT C-terminal dimerisation domain-containing protein n=1 Tax=Daphnia sinensis TaxID=1820382 RepID=A0AAD5PVD6_9CRUS|nr:hypothetical protein GHT06_013507 [Daphnia sinensis]
MYDKKDGKGFLVKCLICHKTKTKFNKKGEIELLTITNNSGYNAKRHIRAIHPTHPTEFNSAWQRRNQEPSEEILSSNPDQTGLSSSTTRRVKKANQPSIKNHMDSSWKYKQIRTQEDLDKAILNHLIADLVPFSEVDKEAFKNLIGGLCGPLVIRGRPFMVELLMKTYNKSKVDLILELDKADFVSTTADCLTSRHRSFLGMTVHWMGQDLARRSACLGVRRVYGSHTYNVVGKAISDVHTEFKISSKVNCTITDNGSNFLKAFDMFKRPSSLEKKPAAYEDVSHDEDEEDDFVFIDIDEILNCGLEEVDLGDADHDLCLEDHIYLPPHMSCTCHSLNLVATTDVKNIDSVRFQKLKSSVDAKLTAVWNKQSRSSLTSDFIKATMGELFVIHNATRWNSYYDALEFLREYTKIMKPLTEALDVFQNEKNMSAGCVLPVLTIFMEKIAEFKEDRNINHRTPLVNCLSDGIEKRFQSFFLNGDLRLASLGDPRFKLSWLTKEKKPEYVKLLEKEVMKTRSNL